MRKVNEADQVFHNGPSPIFSCNLPAARLFVFASAIIFAVLVSSLVRAAVITVNTDTSGSGCTIMDAIDSANANSPLGGCLITTTGVYGDDTIILPQSNNIQTLFAVNNSNPFGPNGLPIIRTKIIIEGNNGHISRLSTPATPAFRLFYVTTSGDLTLKNVRLRGGLADDGSPGATTITDQGSAVFNYGGDVKLENCTISDNTSGETLGGSTLFNQSTGSFDAQLIIDKSTITQNVGGGIRSTAQGAVGVGSTLTMSDSAVSSSSGAGVTVANGSAHISRSEISDNDFSGVLTGNDVSLAIYDSTISGNSTTYSGGGVSIVIGVGPPVVTLINNTISNNTAAEGGGIEQDIGTLTLVNNVVSGNHTSGAGKEIRRTGGTAGNQRNNLLGVSSITTAQALSGFATTGSDITATSDGTRPTLLSGIIGPLARNGGSTRTHALPSDSPAKNEAVITYFAGFFQTGCASILFFPTSRIFYRNDQRGIKRPQDLQCDIGAFELKETSFYILPIPGNKSIILPL